MVCAFRPLLSEEWIQADIHFRDELARRDYPNLTPEERPARLTSDLSPELSGIIPGLVRVFHGTTRLKLLDGSKRERKRLQLRKELDRFTESLRRFMKSPKAIEIFKPGSAGVLYPRRHTTCCPPPPFPPEPLAFPPAGYLRLLVLGMQLWVATVLYSTLHPPPTENTSSASASAKISPTNATPASPSSYNTQSAALSLCRTYSALEQAFPQDNLFPCFNPLVIAGLTCPLEIRMWLWHKLAHFEELGYLSIEPVKRQLSVIWGMPQLLTGSFKEWKECVPGGGAKILEEEDIDIMVKMQAVELEDT